MIFHCRHACTIKFVYWNLFVVPCCTKLHVGLLFAEKWRIFKRYLQRQFLSVVAWLILDGPRWVVFVLVSCLIFCIIRLVSYMHCQEEFSYLDPKKKKNSYVYSGRISLVPRRSCLDGFTNLKTFTSDAGVLFMSNELVSTILWNWVKYFGPISSLACLLGWFSNLASPLDFISHLFVKFI